jgi:hypothetical protein
MVLWAIQRADERWLAIDYGWTTGPDGMLRFRYSYEGEEQVVRLVTSGVACRMVAVSDSPRAGAAASCVDRCRPEPRQA